jgi:hypothetical protein
MVPLNQFYLLQILFTCLHTILTDGVLKKVLGKNRFKAAAPDSYLGRFGYIIHNIKRLTIFFQLPL